MTQTSLQELLAQAQAAIASGKTDEAIAALHQAIALEPDNAQTHNTLGVVLHKAGRVDEAIVAYRRALELAPQLLDAHFNLSIGLRETGQVEQAIEVLQKALILRPGHADGWNDLGNLFQVTRKWDQAIDAYRQALAIRAEFPLAWSNLGNVLRSQKRPREAIIAYSRALTLQPTFAEAWNNISVALRENGQLEESVDACCRALKLRPNFAGAHDNLGTALWQQGRFEEATVAYRQAISILPDFAEGHNNLAAALLNLGQYDQAADSFRRAIALRPDYPVAHYGLSLILLLQGDFHHGWQEYEWRRRALELGKIFHDFPQPMWDGSDLGGRRILLHAEQGFGDAIHFVRYLPLVKQRGAGEIVLLCPTDLMRLFQNLDPDAQLVARNQPLPDFDVHCPLLSLPRVFNTTQETIPATVPYLRADPQQAEAWRERLKEFDGWMKIGVAWAGRSDYRNDRTRSVPLETFAPFANKPNACFLSLQKGEASAQSGTPPANMRLIDWTSELRDFADTAALIENLDLIITVDTSVAHLAGAMGKPVWVLLPFVPDWRWMLNRNDSPWYPTMRLFRQSKLGDWITPVHEVVEAM